MPYWSVVEGYRGTPLSVKLAIEETSTVVTDVTDHVVRDTALPLGLVDNKVCAIDATWTGLRLVWRVSVRDARE
jgi:hypothetical protein